MKQPRKDAQEFINKSKHKKCISSILQSMRTLSSSPCQLRLGVVLRHLSLSPYSCLIRCSTWILGATVGCFQIWLSFSTIKDIGTV